MPEQTIGFIAMTPEGNINHVGQPWPTPQEALDDSDPDSAAVAVTALPNQSIEQMMASVFARRIAVLDVANKARLAAANQLMHEVARTVQDIHYRGWVIDFGSEDGKVWLELLVMRTDAITGAWGQGRGGRRWLATDATPSDIVRTVFGMVASYEEHERREFFRYRGRRVFGPHLDLDAMVGRLDYVVMP